MIDVLFEIENLGRFSLIDEPIEYPTVRTRTEPQTFLKKG
jgi:hypothetical protein